MIPARAMHLAGQIRRWVGEAAIALALTVVAAYAVRAKGRARRPLPAGGAV